VVQSDQRFDRLGISPATNPAVLATSTWRPEHAWQEIREVGEQWRLAATALRANTGWSTPSGVDLPAAAAAHRGAAAFGLAGLADGQHVLVELGPGGGAQTLGEPLGTMRLDDGLVVSAFPTDAGVLDRYLRLLAPHKGPRPLGATPRLGIGCRMTTAVWPGVFEAMRTYGFAANPVQNSVRELSTLDDVLAGRPPERNYACGFGTIESGYTGSTYEGLWVAGVLAALQEGASLQYGADADHLQVKRGPNGRARALELVKASRYYTFFTLDMADMLHYGALNATEATSFLDDNVANALERRAILAVHVAPLQAGDVTCCPTVELVNRFAAKYWDALDAFEDLVREISAHKDGQTFDLEFTVDEHPAEVNAFDCLTSPEELVFLLREIERRGLPVTHLAPNYGAEKGWDYRGTDGLEALGHRVAALQAIAGEFGVMLDFHSADDLSAPVRAVLHRATGGWLHYKISPMLQLLFAEVLQDHYPELFRRWWEDSLEYARREAVAGSDFAADCIRADETGAHRAPSRHDQVFHHYGFAYVGRRTPEGKMPNREQFYKLSDEFYRAYQRCLVDYLGTLAVDLFER
jgi:hypothetical protein